jgi:3-oxosteroid 1-dehydrogenase
VSNNLSIFLGFRNPEERPGGTALCRLSGIQELVAPHTIVVNRAGRRFADETFFQALAPSLRVFDPKTRTQPNLPCFLIFDRDYSARHSFAGRAPGAPIPDWVPRADTLPALAEKLGVAADGLVVTVARFNRDVAAGADSEFQRGETPWGQLRFKPGQTLGAIATPPFHGIELHPTALASAGLRTDCEARVLDMRGAPLEGLFAIGNAAARKETGSGYQTGFSLGSAMVFGLLAARALASTHAADIRAEVA